MCSLHDIAEILLKVTLITNKSINQSIRYVYAVILFVSTISQVSGLLSFIYYF